MEVSLSRQKFSNLENATPPQFNDCKPQQWCSNDWIVYNTPSPSRTESLYSPQATLLPPPSKGGERKQAGPSNSNSIMTSHGGKGNTGQSLKWLCCRRLFSPSLDAATSHVDFIESWTWTAFVQPAGTRIIHLPLSPSHCLKKLLVTVWIMHDLQTPLLPAIFTVYLQNSWSYLSRSSVYFLQYDNLHVMFELTWGKMQSLHLIWIKV